MTNPTTQRSEAEQQAAQAYLLESLSAMSRWQTRAKYICYTVGIITLVGTFLVTAGATGSFPASMMAGFAVAIVAELITVGVVLPRQPLPVLRCPWCGGRVPLLASSKPFAQHELTSVCPSCKRDLPVL